MKSKFLVLLSILAVMCWAVVAFPSGAQATASLFISDGIPADDVTVVDGSTGVVTFNGAVGSNWTINLIGGISQSATPIMDLVFQDLSNGGGTLSIKFTDTNFSGPFVPLMAIGGTTNGTVSYQAFFDNGNVPFAMTTLINSLGPFSGGAYSGTASGSLAPTSPFSLTELVTVTHGAGGGISSGDAGISGVPVPPSVLLLGSGLLGLVGLRRFRKS